MVDGGMCVMVFCCCMLGICLAKGLVSWMKPRFLWFDDEICSYDDNCSHIRCLSNER